MLIIIILVLVILCILFLPYPREEFYLMAILPFINNFNKRSPLPYRKRNIKIITAEDRKNEYIVLHDLSFSRYAQKHGYEYTRLDNCPKWQSTTYWCKIHKVKEMLNTDCDYVMWVDSDTIIVKDDEPLDKYISNFGEPDIIIGYDGTWPFNNIFRCNAGVFLIKNSEVGRQFIEDCLIEIHNRDKCVINGKETGNWSGLCYEQGIMNMLLKTKYSKNVYSDISTKFILNYNDKIYDTCVLHLAGSSNKERSQIFGNKIFK